jgi:hypothetical protein
LIEGKGKYSGFKRIGLCKSGKGISPAGVMLPGKKELM